MTAAVRLVATTGYQLGRQPSCSDTCRCWVTELHGSARAQLRTTAQMILIVCSRKVEISASQDIILTHAGTLTHT